MINKYLKELKDTSRMTMQQISEESGVPISTIERILNGKTEQPAFQTVCDIVIAMNGSIDVLVGIKEKSGSDNNTKCDATNCAIIDLYERQKKQDEEWRNNIKEAYKEQINDLKRSYDDHIAQNEEKYKEEARIKNLWLRRMFYICVGMIIFLIGLVICDFLVAGNGLIRFD